MSEATVEKKAGVNAAFKTIKKILDDARTKAYHAVNFCMVQAYWNIDRVIVEEEQNGRERSEYGKHLLSALSQKLSKNFG